jgi:hypothetical protein
MNQTLTPLAKDNLRFLLLQNWGQCLLAVATMLVLGCGNKDSLQLPSITVQSSHFRYFATSKERIPTGILDRLEKLRSDVYGYLGIMDERLITYYRFDHIEDFNYLDGSDKTEGMCIGSSVYTAKDFDQHEVIHALLSQWPAPPIIAEGIAEALHCDTPPSWVYGQPATMDWPEVVSATHHNSDVYRWGARLVLHLIRKHGPKAFIQYYQSGHSWKSSSDFVQGFEGFWQESWPLVWSSLTTALPSVPAPICPCGHPVLPTDGSTTRISEFNDYLVLPEIPVGQSLLLSFNGVGPAIGRCEDSALTSVTVSAPTDGPVAAEVVAHLRNGRFFLSTTGESTVSARVW